MTEQVNEGWFTPAKSKYLGKVKHPDTTYRADGTKRDQFKEMHDHLTAHGYTTTDHKLYKHHSGEYHAHLRPNSIHNGQIQMGKPQAVHSRLGKRFQDGDELKKHLEHYHGKVNEDAPTNSMGASSATSGPINTYDPLLKIKKKGAKSFSQVVKRKD